MGWKSWETPTAVLANIATMVGVAIAVAALCLSKPIINNVTFLLQQDDKRTSEKGFEMGIELHNWEKAKLAASRLEKYPEYSGISERLKTFETSNTAPEMLKANTGERTKTYQYLLNGIGTLP